MVRFVLHKRPVFLQRAGVIFLLRQHLCFCKGGQEELVRSLEMFSDGGQWNTTAGMAWERPQRAMPLLGLARFDSLCQGLCRANHAFELVIKRLGGWERQLLLYVFLFQDIEQVIGSPSESSPALLEVREEFKCRTHKVWFFSLHMYLEETFW